MIRLRKLISCRKTRKGVRGQVATFFIVLMVIVLIAAMFITNLGQVSGTVVTVANAADASTLSLGSSLASTANDICTQLTANNQGLGAGEEASCDSGEDGVKFCKRTGLLGVFLAVVTVVAVAVFFPPAVPAVGNFFIPGATAGATLASTAGIVGAGVVGAGAGAIGGGIAQGSLSGAVWGAAQGFMIGAGIAWGAGQMAGHFGGAFGSSTLASTAYTGTATMGAMAPSVSLTATASAAVALPSAAAIGTAGALAGGGRIYSGLRDAHDIGMNLRDLSQLLNGLPDYERIREGTLLLALSQAADDPNTTVGPNGQGGCFFGPAQYGPAVGDPFDVDGDGNTSEAISCLDYWWSVRVNALAKATASREALVTSFIEGPWKGKTAGTLKDRRDKARSVLYLLERSEVECECQPKGPILSEGPAPELWRRLDRAGYSYPNIFQPGPSQGALRAFLDDPNGTAAPPAGWDSIDAVHYNYDDFLQWANAMVYNPIIHGPQGISSKAEWYKRLADQADRWLPMLYDPASTDDFYDQLTFIKGEVDGWFLTSRDVATRLPPCHLAYGDYPPVSSSQRKQPPYCDNTAVQPGPDGFNIDTNPIYNGTWLNTSSPANLTTGVHLPNLDFNPDFGGTFPGPVCKIDLTHRTTLLDGISQVEAFVQSPSLEDWILADHANSFNNATCPGGTPAVTPTEDMTLESVDAVGMLKWSGGPLPSEIRYTFTYSYECPGGSRQTKQNTKAKSAPAAKDLAVPMVTRAEFLDILGQFREALLNRINPKGNLDDVRHVFGTTDADLGGIFNPEISTEFADGAAGELFISHSSPYFIEAGQVEGEDALEYFLLQVEEFARQMQAAMPPVKDGRLPNPLQQIDDPIGGRRPVDGVYSWQDSRGVHTVTVELGPFKIPQTKSYKTGNWLVGKRCVEMFDYCDNSRTCPYRGPDRTWVRITRQDPSGKDIGLWKWNPFPTTIRKTARAAYDRLDVRICGTSGIAQCP